MLYQKYSIKGDDVIKKILTNNFKHEMIIYAIAEPDTGHVALNCSLIRKSIELGKKVLFYSLEQPEEMMLKRLKLTDTTNLLIKDKLLNKLEEISNTINSFKADIVIIDYFWLLTRETKAEDILILQRISRKYDIPFIIVVNLSYVGNNNIDLSTITLDEFKKNHSKILPIIQVSDRFMLFYQNSQKEYVIRDLIDAAEPKEINIKELL